jgi:hypothetical protein
MLGQPTKNAHNAIVMAVKGLKRHAVSERWWRKMQSITLKQPLPLLNGYGSSKEVRGAWSSKENAEEDKTRL